MTRIAATFSGDMVSAIATRNVLGFALHRRPSLAAARAAGSRKSGGASRPPARLVAMEPAQAPRCPPAGRWAWLRGSSPTNGPTGALVAEWPSTAHSTPSLSALLAKCLALSTVGLSARRLFLPRETDSTNLRLARPMGSRSYLESGPSISTRSAKSRRRRTSAQGACTYRSTSFVTGRHEFPSSVNT